MSWMGWKKRKTPEQLVEATLKSLEALGQAQTKIEEARRAGERESERLSERASAASSRASGSNASSPFEASAGA